MVTKVIALKPLTTPSSMIAAVGHDPETSTLRVEFNSGKVFDYANVNTDAYKNLVEAPSVGAHFSANIKKFPEKYPFTEIVQVKPKAEAKG